MAEDQTKHFRVVVEDVDTGEVHITDLYTHFNLGGGLTFKDSPTVADWWMTWGEPATDLWDHLTGADTE